MIFNDNGRKIETERLPNVGILGPDLAAFMRRYADMRSQMRVVADYYSAGTPEHTIRPDFHVIAKLYMAGVSIPLASRTVQVGSKIEKDGFARVKPISTLDNDALREKYIGKPLAQPALFKCAAKRITIFSKKQSHDSLVLLRRMICAHL